MRSLKQLLRLITIWHLKSQTYSLFFHDRPQNKEKRFRWHPSFGRSQAILLPHVRLICCTFWRKCSSQKKNEQERQSAFECVSKVIGSKNQSTKMKTKLWEYQRFPRKSPWAPYEINTLCFFSCPPDQISPSLKQGPFHSPFEPLWLIFQTLKKGTWSKAWSFWDVFSLGVQCLLLT